jgi:hypothetical protein
MATATDVFVWSRPRPTLCPRCGYRLAVVPTTGFCAACTANRDADRAERRAEHRLALTRARAARFRARARLARRTPARGTS